jgi:hypothetical protein
MRTTGEMPIWAMLLSEYHGVSMNVSKADFWAREIRLAGPDGCGQSTTDADIEAAIRFALRKNADDKGGRHRQTTLNDVMVWIRWHRKDQRQERLGIDPGAESRTEEQFKARMMGCQTCADRWNVLCQAPYRLCVALDEWATQQWGKRWIEARQADRAIVAAECRQAVNMLDGLTVTAEMEAY